MTTQELTQEEINKAISAAYDSVALITELKAQSTLTEEQTNVLNRNVQHIQIMLGKDWFVNSLTPEQKTQLQAIQ